MSTRDRDQQAEEERQQQEQAQLQQQQERMGSNRDFQAPGDDETSTSPIIINR